MAQVSIVKFLAWQRCTDAGTRMRAVMRFNSSFSAARCCLYAQIIQQLIQTGFASDDGIHPAAAHAGFRPGCLVASHPSQARNLPQRPNLNSSKPQTYTFTGNARKVILVPQEAVQALSSPRSDTQRVLPFPGPQQNACASPCHCSASCVGGLSCVQSRASGG